MTYEDLLARARAAEGRTVEAVTGRKFTVGVALDEPGSLRPGDECTGASRRRPFRASLKRTS